MTKWINKEVWLTALKRQQSHVRMYEADGRYSPKQIEKQRQSLALVNVRFEGKADVNSAS